MIRKWQDLRHKRHMRRLRERLEDNPLAYLILARVELAYHANRLPAAEIPLRHRPSPLPLLSDFPSDFGDPG